MSRPARAPSLRVSLDPAADAGDDADTAEADDAPGRYEAVESGETTADRHALTAARHGYDGLVVRTRTDGLAAIGDRRSLDVARGIEIRTDDPASASGAVGNHRPDCEVLLVRGGSPELNRFAVESPRVDVLAAPFSGTGDVNHVVCNRAAANGVRIELNLGPVLRAAGGNRVQAVSKLRKLRELLADANAPFVVSARPASHLELRGPHELAAVGRQLGFPPAAIHAGLREWGYIVRRTRWRRSESFISPGVRQSEREEDDR